ncbi:MAG TPA: hypothetical protein VHO69_07045 [Phototrophicaceae bacterium]|nr:hypothetical protein [Phototrophicaceae bacterium]
MMGYYRWVDRPLRRWLSGRLGGEVGRYHKFWRYDGPLWKAGLLLIIELAVRFIVVLLPLLILILLDVAVRGK